MTTLVLATRNAHKVREIRGILSERWRYLTLADLPTAPSIREDANSFAGNATKKAVAIANWLSTVPSGIFSAAADARLAANPLFVLADDSGLEVDVLQGAPGVYSARFAGTENSLANTSDAANNAKLLRLLKDVPPGRRTARFRSVVALAPVSATTVENASPVCDANEAELRTQLFEGVCEGRIAEAATGAGGFGYDPLFIPTGFDQSFGALSEEIKNRISHRAQALAKVRQFLLALP